MVPPTPPNYERSAVTGAEYTDLDRDRLQRFLSQRAPSLLEEAPPERVATALGYLGASNKRLVPTVAGLAMFGILPQVLRPEWGVSVVRVKGTRLSDPVAARLDLEGALPSLLEQALAFVTEHSRSMSTMAALDSPEAEFPAAVVKEAVLNALMHRDYRLSGRASVRLFDDRMEVWSPGGMPVQFAPEQVAQKGGGSFPRNPLLAATARSLGIMDQIGRGLVTIRQTMADVTSSPVQFAASQADFLLVIPSRLQQAVAADEGGN